MMNPITAGLFSFLVDGSRTMLIAGTRSSGKTSLLGSLFFELMPKYRVIVIEDTLELPVESLRLHLSTDSHPNKCFAVSPRLNWLVSVRNSMLTHDGRYPLPCYRST